MELKDGTILRSCFRKKVEPCRNPGRPGSTNIDYGFRPEHVLQKELEAAKARCRKKVTFEDTPWVLNVSLNPEWEYVTFTKMLSRGVYSSETPPWKSRSELFPKEFLQEYLQGEAELDVRSPPAERTPEAKSLPPPGDFAPPEPEKPPSWLQWDDERSWDWQPKKRQRSWNWQWEGGSCAWKWQGGSWTWQWERCWGHGWQ